MGKKRQRQNESSFGRSGGVKKFKHFVDVIHEGPSKVIFLAELQPNGIHSADDGPPFGGGGGAGWLVGMREGERGGRKAEGMKLISQRRWHSWHSSLSRLSLTRQNKNPLSRFEDCMLTSTD